MRDSVGLAPALSSALGAVLLLAAVAKSRGRRGVQEFVIDLGVAKPFAKSLVPTVIVGELVLGLLLLTGATTVVAAIAAAVTGVFVAVQIRTIRHGTRPCSCFGALTKERTRYAGLLRASAVLGGALLLVATAGSSASPWPQAPPLADLVAGFVLALTVLLSSALIDQTAWFLSVRIRKVVVR